MLHRAGSEVTVVGPGPADLEVFGANLMDSGRREIVLQTSIETSMRALASPQPLASPQALVSPQPLDVPGSGPNGPGPNSWGEAG